MWRALSLIALVLCGPALAADESPVAPSGVNVLVLDLDAAHVQPGEAKVINDLVGQSVARKGVNVTTVADVRRIADVEAQKALLGCESDSSCLADLAGDFGARYVIYGSVASLGSSYVIQLTLYDAEKAEAVERTRVEMRDLSSVTSEIDDAVDLVFTPLVGAPSSLGGVVVGSIGAALLIGGGVAMALSAGPATDFNDTQSALSAEQRAFSDGDATALSRARALQTQADVQSTNFLLLMGGGAASAVVGLALVSGALIWGGE